MPLINSVFEIVPAKLPECLKMWLYHQPDGGEDGARIFYSAAKSARMKNTANDHKMTLPYLTPTQIQTRLSNGEILFYADDDYHGSGNGVKYVYNVTKWIETHPGGKLPILHMRGTFSCWNDY
jgi:hypothetical protein